jgi:hypothetical protein
MISPIANVEKLVPALRPANFSPFYGEKVPAVSEPDRWVTESTDWMGDSFLAAGRTGDGLARDWHHGRAAGFY